MKKIVLNLVKKSGSTPIEFHIKRVVNAGYVGRDQKAVRAHIEELKKEGIAPPPSIPMLFPVFCSAVITDNEIETVEDKTSGEAEFVLLLENDKILIGVGSDHTDRALEALSMLNSKEVCPNVMGKDVWHYDEIKDHWDDLILQSWVRPQEGADEVLYQKALLRTIMTPKELIDLIHSRSSDRLTEGLVIFSGTVPILTHEMIYGVSFRCELSDPKMNRKLSCEYKINRLKYLVEEKLVTA
jgi:hypothetical protein